MSTIDQIRKLAAAAELLHANGIERFGHLDATPYLREHPQIHVSSEAAEKLIRRGLIRTITGTIKNVDNTDGFWFFGMLENGVELEWIGEDVDPTWISQDERAALQADAEAYEAIEAAEEAAEDAELAEIIEAATTAEILAAVGLAPEPVEPANFV